MDTIIWKKPNGTTIETIDDAQTVKHCESLGWKRDEAATKKAAAEKAAAADAAKAAEAA